MIADSDQKTMRARARAPGMLRGFICLAAAAMLLVLGANARADAGVSEGFARFVAELWPDAQKMGVSRATFDRAFRGVTPDLSIPDLVLPGQTKPPGGQAEFTKTPAEYLNLGHLNRLADQGRKLAGRYHDTLTAVEKRFGVPGATVLAIWGRETAFGTYKLPHYAIRVLATQAYVGRRKDLFRKELLYALKMLEDGVRTVDTMKSSWAGAMGLTQFMPSEFYTSATDMDGDGRKDMWNSVPDALGSAAQQLQQKGWVAGLQWGYEVRLPKSASCLWQGEDNAKTVAEWAKAGVVPARGGSFPANAANARAWILTPAGAYGPIFLVHENFMVIKRYNFSDLYAVFVGHLSDRIAGGGDFATPWGNIRQLPTAGIEEIQQRLKSRGYPVDKIDGKIGVNTRSLIGQYQQRNHLAVDCWPTESVLAHMRTKSGT
jgi:lytic murein transglycosylase